MNEYRAVLAIQADSPEAHFGLAAIEYKRCNLSTAAQEAKTAASLSPNVSLYRGLLAAVHEAQGRSMDAAQVYADLHSAPARDAIAHLLGGDYLFRTGKLDEAAREFQLVLETPNLEPLFASLTHSALGQTYYAQDKLIAAQSEFKLALSTLPANADAQARLGDIALRNGDAGGALAAFDQASLLLAMFAQQISADGAATLAVRLQVRRALALTRQGKPADATTAFDQALSLAQRLVNQTPQWAQGHFELALVYLARGDKAKADSEFATATQCDQSLVATRARVEEELAKLR